MHFLCFAFIFLTAPYIASVLTWYRCDNTASLHQKASKVKTHIILYQQLAVQISDPDNVDRAGHHIKFHLSYDAKNSLVNSCIMKTSNLSWQNDIIVRMYSNPQIKARLPAWQYVEDICLQMPKVIWICGRTTCHVLNIMGLMTLGRLKYTWAKL